MAEEEILLHGVRLGTSDNGDGTRSLKVSGISGGGGGGGDASAANQVTANTRLGDVAETAPASDTAPSGLNGRLQRIAQRLTSVIALLPAALGQGTKAQSLAVVPASDYVTPKSDFLEVTGTGAALNATPIAATDVGGYRWISVQVTGTFSATYTFETSDDNTIWIAVNLLIMSSNTFGTGTTVPNVAFGNIAGRYFRIRLSAYTSGTVVATAEFFPLPGAYPALLAIGNVGNAATDSGSPVKTGGKYNATKPTFSDGQRGDTQIEANGSTASSLYGKVSAAGDTPVELVTGSGTPTNALAAMSVVTNGSVFTSTRAAGSLADGNNGGSYPAAGQYWYNGASWDRARLINVLKTVQSTATASGSDLDVWTPAASKKFRLRGIKARASIAGRYEIRDQATIIAYVYMAANTWTTLVDMEANGYLSASANNVLRIRNQSGSAADIDITATGNEE